jgi:hypothetical protein
MNRKLTEGRVVFLAVLFELSVVFVVVFLLPDEPRDGRRPPCYYSEMLNKWLVAVPTDDADIFVVAIKAVNCSITSCAVPKQTAREG